MNSYGEFALVYDKLTLDVDYAARCDYIEEIFARHNAKKPELIADLACGTGSICVELDERGYDMIGIDLSADMLNVAAEKSVGRDILYINQNICGFELYGTVDAALCLLDSINHLTEDDDLDKLFSLVKNYLNPEGLFVFDVNTKFKFEEILSDNIYTYEDDNIFYVWENNYEDEICDIYVNFFVKDGEHYKRIEQAHAERYYSADVLRALAQKYGFSVEGVYGELTFDAPAHDCQREFWVIKKKD
ncbi:MAG: class I SAM-dependent methyltransferase [Clostridia bacterium]|nr:class I SAM-dependent methyltransferase [Clostridia bacterium]